MALATHTPMPASDQGNTASRRALITAAPVAALAAVLASRAEPAAVSPIAEMHREIVRQWEIGNDLSLPEDQSERAVSRMNQLANEIVDIPAQSLADMLIKFMGHTVNGEHGTNECPRSEELWAEARALVA